MLENLNSRESSYMKIKIIANQNSRKSKFSKNRNSKISKIEISRKSKFSKSWKGEVI